jgi:hypothetical protein
MIERFDQSKRTDAIPLAVTESERKMVLTLKAPIESLVRQLHGKFIAGEYEYIVGDDVSGRIPTLILGKIARHIAHKHGKHAPEIRFLAGSRVLSTLDEMPEKKHLADEKRLMLRDYFHELHEKSPHKTGKVLLSTDSVDKGRTVMELLEAAKDAGWHVDLATVGISIDSPYSDDIDDTKIYSGQRGVPEIFYARYQPDHAVGLDKLPGELHAFIDPESNHDAVVRVRQLAATLADEMIAEYDRRA